MTAPTTDAPTAFTPTVLGDMCRTALAIEADPRAAARIVLDELDPEQYRAALAIVLPGYLYTIAAGLRNRPRPATDTAVGAPRTPIASTPQFRPPAPNPAPVPTATVQRPTVSTKVAAVRDWWTETKNASVSIDGVYKRFGDATLADLRVLVSRRREQAANTLEVAARFERYAEALAEHKVATVAELPEVIARALWDAPTSGDSR